MELCVYDIEVLKLTYGEMKIVPVIVGIKIIKGSHGAFDVVGGIIAQNTQIENLERSALKFCWISCAVSALLYNWTNDTLPFQCSPNPGFLPIEVVDDIEPS